MDSRSAVACAVPFASQFQKATVRTARTFLLAFAAIALALVAPAQSPRPRGPQVHLSAKPAASPNASTPIVATPVISLAPGSYSGPQTVTVTDATPGVTMYYTTNGSGPSTNSPQYNGPITISNSGTLVVLATLPGYKSNVAYAAYYITSVPDSFVYGVAGSGWPGYAGDGGPATQALINQAASTAEDGSGNIYIADGGNNAVRKVDANTGIITTIAGTGTAGYSGDGGPASAAELNYPDSLGFDSAGNLYISDEFNGVIRKFTISTGVISTYAGNRNASTLGDGGPATSANIGSPTAIAIDGSDNVYILSGGFPGRVREVDAKTQVITTVAGGGSNLETAGGPATGVALNSPSAIALDAAANIYIADGVVWKVTRNTGNISVFAGIPNTEGDSGDGGSATSAKLSLPDSLAVDKKGNVYIDDGWNWVLRKVDAATNIISTAAGSSSTGCFAYVENGSASLSSDICFAHGLSFDAAGNLYFINSDRPTISMLTALGTPPSTPTPDPTFSIQPGTYSSPQSLSIGDAALGASVYLYVVSNPPFSYDESQVQIFSGFQSYTSPINLTGPAKVFAQAIAPGHTPSKRVSAAYTYSVPPRSLVSVFAGSGRYSSFSGQSGPATSVGITPDGLAMDSEGNLFIADDYNNLVWKVDNSGMISVFAGTGQSGDTGDNGPATAATLSNPSTVAVDHSGNVFIADWGNNIVREVLASNGNIVPYAGNGQHSYSGSPASYGDGGPATSAYIPLPAGLALDSNSNLYITDNLGQVREVNASTGIIQTVAGSFSGGPLGDGGPATQASLVNPQGLAFDAAGNLYIADAGDSRVRKVDGTTGIISTVVGNGMPGFDESTTLASTVAVTPLGIAFDGDGNMFFSSYESDIRRVDAKTNMISTIAGIGYPGQGYDPEPASMAVACPNVGIVADPQSNIYFSDTCNDTVRKITFNAPAPAPTFDPPAGTYASPQSVTLSDTAPNATIYFTTDGSTPSTSSTQYSGAITVSKTETISAIAVAAGYGQSAVGSAAYGFQTVPTIALVSSQNPSSISQSVTFTATVSSAAGTPTGSVTFFDGTTQLGSGTLTAGSATYSTAALAVGAHSITAQYSGDANFTPVTSTSFSQTVTPFSIGTPAGGSTTSSVAPGGITSFVLSVTPPGSSPVTFSVAGMPAGATSSFSPSTVAAGAGPTMVELIIQTPAQASAAPAQAPPGSGQPSPGSRMPVAFGLLLLPLLGLRKSVRGARRFLLFALLAIGGAAATAAISGCSHNFPTSNNNPPPPGTYALTVTATAGTQTQSTTLTLNVE